METWHLHINGIVQGVGFRPMVYQLAREMQLTGCVENGADGVHINVNASGGVAGLLLKKLKEAAPVRSIIRSAQLYRVADKIYPDFKIVIREKDDTCRQVLVSPDIAVCANCLAELQSPGDRRYRYPFITCTQCGPRYSIIRQLPYERHHTAMEPFTPCKSCAAEYEEVTDRRFFSQTNSCPDCGIRLRIHEKTGPVHNKAQHDILRYIKESLEQGKILAVKGVGGYLLLCDAANEQTIRLLRTRKQRPAKPFALLFPNIEMVRENFELTGSTEDLLLGAAAPIVLLHRKKSSTLPLAAAAIAPALRRLGLMLPCSPLLALIAADYGKPLVATSANISGSPILFRDEEAVANLFGIVDTVISYNRDILLPQDDSVLQVTQQHHQTIILRRSSGYAPAFLRYVPKDAADSIATGALLKSSFSIATHGNLFVSQYLGSGDSYESQQMYRHTLAHWKQLYQLKPSAIIADKHPDYFSHHYAVELANRYGCTPTFVQHHQAHFTALLGEHGLLETGAPVLGIVWDGTGLGDDRNTWGGEFFLYQQSAISRFAYFEYFPAIAGDKLAMEPRLAALCTTAGLPGSDKLLRKKFSDIEWKNYHALIRNSSSGSSSAGRIFDAVACLLDLCDTQTYEGEAAMYLQALAETYVEENGYRVKEHYFTLMPGSQLVSTTELMQGIINDLQQGKEKNYIAAKFHYSMVCIVGMIAAATGIKKIGFSGGVFQNALLVDWLIDVYGEDYDLYFHEALSPNDENISFGQLLYHDNKISSVSSGQLTTEALQQQG